MKNNHGEVLLSVKFQTKIALLKVTLLHGCFSRFLNYTNGIKSRKASHIAYEIDKTSWHAIYKWLNFTSKETKQWLLQRLLKMKFKRKSSYDSFSNKNLTQKNLTKKDSLRKTTAAHLFSYFLSFGKTPLFCPTKYSQSILMKKIRLAETGFSKLQAFSP